MSIISLHLLTFFLFSVADFPSCFSADLQYEECRSPLRCGYGPPVFQNSTYPFWGIGKPEFCGRKGFELNCTERQNLTIKINDLTLRVVSANLENKRITVADESFLEDGCPKMLGFKGDERFTLNPPTTETIDLFNCSSGDSSHALSNITCRESNMITSTYHFFGSFVYTHNCSKIGDIPILASAKNALQSNGSSLTKALEEGFELRYNTNDTVCQSCSTSEGICGSDSESGNFRCLCEDKPHKSSCDDEG